MSSEDKRFLIRSSGHILGPFFKDEVIDLIKKGKISVFDEVAEPYTIWFYLQDHADFKKIVHSVSMQTRLVNFLSSVSTKISTISKQTKNKTTEGTVEQTITETKKQPLSLLEKQSASEVSVESIKPISSTELPSAKGKYQSETESEEAVRKKITFFVNWTWKIVILAVLAVGSYILYKEIYMPIKQKQNIQSEFDSKGMTFYQAGNFKKALPFFEIAYSNNLLNDNEKILFASLLIQEDKLSKALVIKNELLDSPAFKKAQGLLLDSLLAYYQKDYKHFTKQTESLIKSNPKEEIQKTASLNLALFHWKNKNYDKSIDYLDKQLLAKGFERDIVFYLKALNLLFQNKLEKLETYLINTLKFDKKAVPQEFKQESYFLLAYIYMKKQDNQNLNSYIIKLLNEDPFLYQNYSYSSFIAKNTLFNWSYLYSFCREIFNYDSSKNLFKALYGFCHLKANDLKSAEDYIKQAKNTDPANSLFLALDSYLIMKTDNDAFQLEQIFSLINYDKTILPLPFILKARFLESQEEWENSLLTWKQLLSLESHHLSGLAETAFINYTLGNKTTGDIYATKALKIYEHYTKLQPYKSKSL